MEGEEGDGPGAKRLRKNESFKEAAAAKELICPAKEDTTKNDVRKFHVVPRELNIGAISSSEAWAKLSTQEKYYCTQFSKAAWAGSRICCAQVSEESPAILRILMLLFYEEEVNDFRDDCLAAGVAEDAWRYFVAYAACFLANMGNYLAFGDCKIVPGISEEEFDEIVKLGCMKNAWRKKRLLELWHSTKRNIYSLEPEERHLGLPSKGVTVYYRGGISLQEITLVQEWMANKGIDSWNTRLQKRQFKSDSGLPEYEVLIASSTKHPTQTFENPGKCVIHLVFGDHMEELREVVFHLNAGLPYAANDNQRAALLNYIKCFETGSVDAHKEAQKHWVLDNISPIDANIGFVETYRDPLGLRAEFEGFVALKNEIQSEKFALLADAAQTLRTLLPWPKDFQNGSAVKPGFSSLDLSVFANGNVPAGINIPNYDDIRESVGYKNIVFGNVLLAKEFDDDKIAFLTDSDKALCRARKSDALEVQVGCHELLGHGSGKLFIQESDDTYNYNYGKVIHPFTGEAVTSCYGPGETWDSVFGQISASYEECRAEAVGLFFSTNQQVLEIFGHSGQDAEDVTYTMWLLMVRAGLLGLEFYSPETCTWRQAHMQARFAILRVLLSASAQNSMQQRISSPQNVFLRLRMVGNSDVVILLNRDKVKTVGAPAITELLKRLQIYKSTADVTNGTRLFEEMSRVPDYLLPFRDIVLAKKKARPFFVQANAFEGPDGITLKEYPASCEGVVESFVDRFRPWVTTF